MQVCGLWLMRQPSVSAENWNGRQRTTVSVNLESTTSESWTPYAHFCPCLKLAEVKFDALTFFFLFEWTSAIWNMRKGHLDLQNVIRVPFLHRLDTLEMIVWQDTCDLCNHCCLSGRVPKIWHCLSSTGRIINVGSLAGERNNPEPGLSIYSGTKHAIEGLSEALRYELSRHGVDVTVVQPDVAFLENCLLDQHHKYVHNVYRKVNLQSLRWHFQLRCRKMNEMWNEMTPELRLANQDIFIAYHDRVAKSQSEELDMDEMGVSYNSSRPNSHCDARRSVMPVYLRRCFDDALMNKSPSDVYVAVPSCATSFRIGLLAVIPSGWREYFIQRKYKHNIANILRV